MAQYKFGMRSSQYAPLSVAADDVKHQFMVVEQYGGPGCGVRS